MLARQLCASHCRRRPRCVAPRSGAPLRPYTSNRPFARRWLATAANPALALGRLNHLAIAVPDLEASVALYRDVLGAQVSEPESLTEHGVTVVFVELPNTKIELLHPYGDESPIQGFLDKNPSGGASLAGLCVCASFSLLDNLPDTSQRRALGLLLTHEWWSVGMHHVCIEVPDVTAAIAELKSKGIRVLSDEPKIGAHNKPVVFLHPKDCGGVLTELEEE
jgi:methylmalonyl-CoA/ethylmalonyl-CoA epimerase